MNSVAVKGSEIRALEKKRAALKQQQQSLALKEAQLRAIHYDVAQEERDAATAGDTTVVAAADLEPIPRDEVIVVAAVADAVQQRTAEQSASQKVAVVFSR